MAVRRSGGILIVALFLLGSALGCTDAPADPTPQAKIAAPPVLPEHLELLTGTATCSARGCHGALEPVKAADSTVLQDEYTKWLAHDKHANAYLVLFTERSRNIIRHLGTQQAAHENDRCLVCHTNGLTAAALASSAKYKEEATFGVGCEACHGGAKEWLGPHTQPSWKTALNKKGILDLADPVAAASACVPCHVGAPASREMPLRDVNHDLIAAGHPRLSFEYTAYLADLPAHFDRVNLTAKKRTKDPLFKVRDWAVGQLVSAEAALLLLAHRANHADDSDSKKLTPWPEFAEYDCFACHHDLQARSWRQQRGYANRAPGSLLWGTWYQAMPRLLAAESPDQKRESGLAELERLMQWPSPPPQEVVRQVGALAAPLRGWLQGVKTKKYTSQEAVELRKKLAAAKALPDAGWDGPAQLYLALAALSEHDPKARAALRELLKELNAAFERDDGKQRDDSPGRYTPDRLRDLLGRIR